MISVYVREGYKGYYWKYFNTQSETGVVAVYILVSLTYDRDDKPFEWRAYIGASVNGSYNEVRGWKQVAQYGSKLRETEARGLFPELNEIPYAR